MNQMWALLWSQKHNSTSVEKLEQVLSINRIAYTNNSAGDYRVLFIGSRSEMDEAAEAVRSTIAKREFDLEGVV